MVKTASRLACGLVLWLCALGATPLSAALLSDDASPRPLDPAIRVLHENLWLVPPRLTVKFAQSRLVFTPPPLNPDLPTYAMEYDCPIQHELMNHGLLLRIRVQCAAARQAAYQPPSTGASVGPVTRWVPEKDSQATVATLVKAFLPRDARRRQCVVKLVAESYLDPGDANLLDQAATLLLTCPVVRNGRPVVLPDHPAPVGPAARVAVPRPLLAKQQH